MKLKIFKLNRSCFQGFLKELSGFYFFSPITLLSKGDFVQLYEVECKTLLFSVEHCMFVAKF